MASKALPDPLQLAKTLVRTVARMFYDTEHIVIVDALVFHNALTISDLVMVLDAGKNTKGVQKLCGKLKEGGLISVYVRQETRVGAQKAINREYFFIDYRRAIDSAKYKIHKIHDRVNKDAKPTAEKAELWCPRCKAQWTTMEVLDLVDFMGRESGFLCKKCSHPLNNINATDEVQVDNDDTPAKFNRLFGPLLDLMQRIDDVTIPAIEGKDALENAVELPRDKDINPTAKHEVVENTSLRPTAVKGTTTAPEKIEVQIATDAEYTEEAAKAERARQEKIAAQNSLPDWHTKSTVVKTESHSATVKQEANGTGMPAVKTETVEQKMGKEDNVDTFFAALEEERRKKEAEEEDEEEEDDEDFEDVTVGTPNPVPDAKRVKLESSAAPTPTNLATPAASGDGGDESDEDEFVDV